MSGVTCQAVTLLCHEPRSHDLKLLWRHWGLVTYYNIVLNNTATPLFRDLHSSRRPCLVILEQSPGELWSPDITYYNQCEICPGPLSPEL